MLSLMVTGAYAKGQPAALLHKHGFRATAGRIALLELLRDAGTPLSAISIMEKIGGKLDQANIYRALEALANAGLLRRVDLGHQHAHYEWTGGQEHHHHIICKTCGETGDVPEGDLRAIERHALRSAKRFARIDDHALEFFGVCKKCARETDIIRKEKI